MKWQNAIRIVRCHMSNGALVEDCQAFGLIGADGKLKIFLNTQTFFEMSNRRHRGFKYNNFLPKYYF